MPHSYALIKKCENYGSNGKLDIFLPWSVKLNSSSIAFNLIN